jgi:hypothetical protein
MIPLPQDDTGLPHDPQNWTAGANATPQDPQNVALALAEDSMP